MGGEGAHRSQGLCTPGAGGSGDCPLALPLPHTDTEPGRAGLCGGFRLPQLQWDSRALQALWQGRPRAALFPSLYLPDNGTIQQVLNVLMGFGIASVAHLPQGHFTPSLGARTDKKKRPVVYCINCLMTEHS